MKIHTTKLMGFYGVFMDISWVLCKWFYLLLVWGPTGAEDKGQIKAQLGGTTVRLSGMAIHLLLIIPVAQSFQRDNCYQNSKLLSSIQQAQGNTFCPRKEILLQLLYFEPKLSL